MQEPLHNPISEHKRPKLNFIKIATAFVALALVFSLGVTAGHRGVALHKAPTVAKGLPNDLDYSSVEAIYDKLHSDYDGQLDQTKLLDGIKAGLAQATGDPYTEYFTASAAKDFNNELNGTFSGIGAELGKDAKGNIIVISPIAGFPAEKAGLKAKDMIVEVDGKPTTGQTIDEAVGKIRGPANTTVKLKIIRDNQEVNLEITRAEIKVPSVKSEITDDNVGILIVSRFGDDTVGLAREAAQKFKDANVKGVVLDLRGDPGGLLDAAVGVSSLWLDKGQTVLLEKRGGVVDRTYRATGNPLLKGVKTAVLVNEGSASASEITAGALRDNKAATLIGTKSFGKGSVQQLESLDDGSMVKITIAHWFTPSGKGIDKTGLEPDQKVDRSDDDLKNDRDPQKDAALNFVKS